MKIGNFQYGNLVKNEDQWFISFNAFNALRSFGFRSKESMNKYIELPLHPSSFHLLKKSEIPNNKSIQFMILEDYIKISNFKCHVCENISMCECKIQYGKINDIFINKKRSIINTDYWKERCLAAEKYIFLSNIESSNLPDNIKALEDWQEIKIKHYY